MFTGSTRKGAYSGSGFNITDFNETQQTNRSIVLDISDSIDETMLLKKTGGIITGDLYLSGESRLIFLDGSVQGSAFDDSSISKLNQSDNKVQNISAVPNNTVITGALSVDSLIIPDDALDKSKIQGLTGSLMLLSNRIQSNTDEVTTHTTNINTINDYNTTNTTHRNTINANISTLTDRLDTIDTNLSTITTGLTTTQTDLTNLTDSTTTDINSIQTRLTDVEAQSNTSSTDITQIQNSIQSINTTVQTNSSDITTNTTQIETINSRLVNLETINISNEVIDQTNATLNDFSQQLYTIGQNTLAQEVINNNQIDQIQTISTNLSDNITSVNNRFNTNETNIQDISTTVSAHSTTISSLETTTSQNSNTLTTLSSIINGVQNTLTDKQDIISSQNRINTNLIGQGLISDTKFETLVDINTNETIQHQINTIKTSLTSLSGLQDIDITNINQMSTNITNILNDISLLTGEDATQTQINTTVQTNLSNLSDASTTLQNNLALSNTNIQNLQTDLTTINTYASNIELSLTATNSNVSTLQSELSASNTNITNLQTGLSASNTNISNLQSDLTTTNSNVSNLESALSTTNTNITNIQSDLSTTNTNITNLTSSKQDVIDQTNALNTDYIQYNSNPLTAELDSMYISFSTINNNLNTINTGISNYESANNTNIDNITQSLLNIESFNTTTHSNIQTIQSDITNLNQIKQDSINDVNPLNSIYVQYKTTNAYDAIEQIDNSIASIGNNIDTIQYYITNINQNKQSAINDANPLNSIYVWYKTTNTYDALESIDNSIITINDNISNINGSITSIQSNKQNLIDSGSKLPVNLVDLGSSALSHVDISTSLQDDLNALSNLISGHTTSIATNDTAISNLQAQDIIHDTGISQLNTNVSNLQNNKQDIISGSNLLSSDLVSTGLTEVLTDKLISIDSALSSLDTSKQSVINSGSKLPVSLVDLGSSALSYVNITAPLQTTLTNITNAISTLQGFDSGATTSFQAIQDNFDILSTSIAGKQDAISSTYTDKFQYLANVTSDIQTQISNISASSGGTSYPSISYDAPTTTTTITDTAKLTTLKFTDNSIQESAFTSTDKTNLTSVITDLTTAQTDISNLQSDLGTKQTVINSGSKLPVSLVDLGSSALSYIDISSSLSTTLTGLSNSLSSLVSADISQDALNTQYTTDINTLYNNKNDIISSTNKISGSYVTYNTTTVKDELDSINNSLATKQTIIDSSHLLDASNIGTGVITNTKLNYLTNVSSDIQTQVDSKASTSSVSSKQDIINSSNRLDASNIGTGVITNTIFNYLTNVSSDIQTQLNAKATAYNASNFLNSAYIGTGAVTNTVFNYLSGVTSSIQTQLTGKVDKSGAYMTGDLTMGFNTNNAGLAYQGVGAGYYLVSDATGRFMPTPPSSPQLTKVEGTISTANIAANTVTTFGTINLGAGAWMLVINPYLEFQNTTAASISAGFTGGVPVLKNQYNQTEFWGQIQLMSITTIPANGYRCAGYSPILQLIYPDGDYTYTLTYTHYYSTNAGISCKWKSATNTMSSMFAIKLF